MLNDLYFWISVIIAFFIGAISVFLINRLSRRKPPLSLTAENSDQKTLVLPEPISPRVLLTEMMENMREGVIVVAQNTRIMAHNSAARNIFSHVPEELENRRLTEITRNLEVHEAFRAALESKQRREVKVETRSGDKRIFDLRVAPLNYEGNNESNTAIGIFFDITQLEKLEKVRQEFLSNVSHELRTPLTSILAFVETLEDGAIDDVENNRRFLGVIRKNSERMRRLIDDILELSSIEAGKVSVEPQKIRLAPMVEEIRGNLQVKAKERNISIVNEIPKDVFVYADAGRLEQMLTNLMDNAVKFNREAGSVTVSFAQSDNEKDLISVADTGEGISPEHLERLFERFYRTDRARSRDIGGTGLGLSIVKHLAKLHGGEAYATSILNTGSIFTIELPKFRIE